MRGPQASSEMTVLLAEAEQINASVVLGDRDVDLTLKRAQSPGCPGSCLAQSRSPTKKVDYPDPRMPKTELKSSEP